MQHREASEPGALGGPRLQRAVVLELLGDDGERRRSSAQLGQELGADAEDLEAAVAALCAAGVLHREGDLTWASAAARRLDELELIAI
jgi:hypothetical protein